MHADSTVYKAVGCRQSWPVSADQFSQLSQIAGRIGSVARQSLKVNQAVAAPESAKADGQFSCCSQHFVVVSQALSPWVREARSTARLPAGIEIEVVAWSYTGAQPPCKILETRQRELAGCA